MEIEIFKDWACKHPIAKDYAEILAKNGVTRTSMLRPGIVTELTQIGIPSITASDIVEEYRAQAHIGDVAIFWDIESVRPPHGVSVVEAARSLVKGLRNQFRGNVSEFKVFLDAKGDKTVKQSDLLSLLDCNIEVINCPHIGVGPADTCPTCAKPFEQNIKETADKMIIVDVLCYAMECRHKQFLQCGVAPSAATKLPTICIASGDRDFSPLLSKLSKFGFHVISVVASTRNVYSNRQIVAETYDWSAFGVHPQQLPAQSAAAATAGPPPPYGAPPPSKNHAVPSSPSSVAVASSSAAVASPVAAPNPLSTNNTNNNDAPDDDDSFVRVSTAVFEDADDIDAVDPHKELKEAIMAVIAKQKPAEGRRSYVRQSAVGGEFKSMIKTFREAKEAALSDGVVEVAGQSGLASIRLTDSVASECHFLLVGSAKGVLPYREVGIEPRKILLLSDLYAAKGVSVTVNAARMLYGPFDSSHSAENFSQTAFANLNSSLRMRITKDENDIDRCQISGEMVPLSSLAPTGALRLIFSNVDKSLTWCDSERTAGKHCRRGTRCLFPHRDVPAAPDADADDGDDNVTADPHKELREAIMAAVDKYNPAEGRRGFVLQSVVGAEFKSTAKTFREAKEAALRDGVVEVAGQGGLASIRLIERAFA